MKITSKKQAMDKAMEYLFTGPMTPHTIGKFDLGKYKWTGSAKHYHGREVTDLPGVVGVWVERRTDKDGPYAQIMSIGFDNQQIKKMGL